MTERVGPSFITPLWKMTSKRLGIFWWKAKTLI